MAIVSASLSSRRFPGTYGRSDLGIAPYAWETPPHLTFGHLPLKGKAYDGRFVKRHYGGKPRAVEDAGPYKEIAEASPSCEGKAWGRAHTVSMRITLVLPLSPLVLPPVMTTVSPG